MKIEDIKIRIDELINLAHKTLETSYDDTWGYHVEVEAFQEFRTASLSFLKNVFSENQTFYQEFLREVTSPSQYATQQARGILKAAKQEIDNGWIFTVKGLISAEIFSDFLEMSKYFLDEKYKDPAAVMIGSVLEETLRQIAIKNSIDIIILSNNGTRPKKADTLNSDICKANVYSLLEQKQVTAWLDLRNKAAHGLYDKYDLVQVELMYQGVMNFIIRFNH